MEVASEFHKPSFHGQPTLFQESQQTLQQKEISHEEHIIILTHFSLLDVFTRQSPFYLHLDAGKFIFGLWL